MSTGSNSPLPEIVDALDRTTRLDPRDIRKWMKSDDLEALGALMALLSDSRHDSRIDPPLEPEEYYPFVRDYYMRSMLENPDSEWADPTTIAGHDFARWFQRLWSDDDVPRSVISEIKDSLKRTYIAASSAVQANIVTSALEDLFRDSEIFDYFADWRDDQMLSGGYREAKKIADAARAIKERTI